MDKNKDCTSFLNSDFVKIRFINENFIEGALSFLNNCTHRKENFEKGNVVILCLDSGWFSAGKNIKDEIGNKYNVVNFCLSDGLPFEKNCEKLLKSVENISSLIVVGSEEMALFTARLLPSIPLCFIPLNYEFENFSQMIFKVKDSYYSVVLDENYLEKLPKNKTTSAVKSVISKNILFVEMLVNSAIGSHFDYNLSKKYLNEGQKYLNDFFLYNKSISLCLSIICCCYSIVMCDVGDITNSISKILLKEGDFCDLGEGKFLAFKMLVRIYRLYLSDNHNYLLRKGNLIEGESEVYKLFKGEGDSLIQSVDKINYSDSEIVSIKEKILKDEKVLKKLKSLDELIPLYQRNLHALYRGRKYTIEHYSKKQRAKALLIAPFITEGFCFLSVIYADGFFDCLQ